MLQIFLQVIVWIISLRKLKNKLIKCQSCTHTETSQLIYKANQLTGFYMKIRLAFNGLMSKH